MTENYYSALLQCSCSVWFMWICLGVENMQQTLTVLETDRPQHVIVKKHLLSSKTFLLHTKEHNYWHSTV